MSSAQLRTVPTLSAETVHAVALALPGPFGSPVSSWNEVPAVSSGEKFCGLL
jgi:hypothetical protein